MSEKQIKRNRRAQRTRRFTAYLLSWGYPELAARCDRGEFAANARALREELRRVYRPDLAAATRRMG